MVENIFAGIILGLFLGAVINNITEDRFISLEKRKWNCTQSRILDTKNVDKTECIVYKKEVKGATTD